MVHTTHGFTAILGVSQVPKMNVLNAGKRKVPL
jgi:hypothetical protein